MNLRDFLKLKNFEGGGSSGGSVDMSEPAQIDALVEADLLPAVYDADGKILTDENGNVILRY